MWKIKNVLFSLKSMFKVFIEIDSLIGNYSHKKQYYLFPITEWEDNKNIYDYEIILDENGDIIDYSWSYEIKKDVEGMFQ